MKAQSDKEPFQQDADYRLACDCIRRDYDFVLTVRTADRTIAQVLDTGVGKLIQPGADYQKTAANLIRRTIIPGDVGTLAADIQFERVLSALEDKGQYIVRFSGEDLDCEPRVRELNYTYRSAERTEICVTCQDITRRIREETLINRKLATAMNEAVRANEAKTDFLSRMSHDMRTPLNGVIGMTELALEESDPERIREYMTQVSYSGKLLLSLINNVLDMARIEKGKLELHPEPYRQSELLRYIQAAAMPLCQPKKQTFQIIAGDDDLVFMADSVRLNQILFNLISNASKYTHEGGAVRFSMRRFNAGHGHGAYANMIGLRFEITDNGIGISKEFLEHIFEPFSREEIGAKAVTQGTGLGLAIVRSLVDIMHGQIKLVSKPGQGTNAIVTLMFPLVQTENKTAGEKADTQEKEASDYDMLADKRVLVVEDNRTNAKLLQLLLKKKAVLTDRAENGRKALEMFMENEVGYYFAILMDVRMPVMDGLEAAKAIRALTRTDAQSIPIIAVTANAFDADAAECIAAGMNGHLSKPIESEKLYTALKRFCS